MAQIAEIIPRGRQRVNYLAADDLATQKTKGSEPWYQRFLYCIYKNPSWYWPIYPGIFRFQHENAWYIPKQDGNPSTTLIYGTLKRELPIRNDNVGNQCSKSQKNPVHMLWDMNVAHRFRYLGNNGHEIIVPRWSCVTRIVHLNLRYG